MDVLTEWPINSELQLKILWWSIDEKDTFRSKDVESLKLKLLLDKVTFHGLDRACICSEQFKLESQIDSEKDFNVVFSHRHVCNHHLLASYMLLSKWVLSCCIQMIIHHSKEKIFGDICPAIPLFKFFLKIFLSCKDYQKRREQAVSRFPVPLDWHTGQCCFSGFLWVLVWVALYINWDIQLLKDRKIARYLCIERLLAHAAMQTIFE